MNVVSNASPLINMACIGKLNLLNQLYGELFIPEAVWKLIGSGTKAIRMAMDQMA